VSSEDPPKIKKLKRKTRSLHSSVDESFLPEEIDIRDSAELSQIIMTYKHPVEMFSKIFNKTISRSPWTGLILRPVWRDWGSWYCPELAQSTLSILRLQ
jgi:hypothetical protein